MLSSEYTTTKWITIEDVLLNILILCFHKEEIEGRAYARRPQASSYYGKEKVTTQCS